MKSLSVSAGFYRRVIIMHSTHLNKEAVKSCFLIFLCGINKHEFYHV